MPPNPDRSAVIATWTLVFGLLLMSLNRCIVSRIPRFGILISGVPNKRQIRQSIAVGIWFCAVRPASTWTLPGTASVGLLSKRPFATSTMAPSEPKAQSGISMSASPNDAEDVEAEPLGTKSDPSPSPAKTRKSTRKKAKTIVGNELNEKLDEVEDSEKPPAKKKRVRGSSSTSPKSPAAKSKKTKKTAPVSGGEPESTKSATPSPKPKKKAASPKHQQITDRVELPKLWDPTASKDSYTYRVASWNVAGLRALMRNHPDALSNLCKEHNLDMLCLQEIKLQESHLDDPKLKIRSDILVEDGYDAHYNCCTAKKGYSGTATFIKRHRLGAKQSKQKKIDSFFSKKAKESADAEDEANDGDERLVPESVSFGIGNSIDDEGRVIVVDLPFGSILNCYVPNSGQKLERLAYRTEEWDKQLLAFAQAKQKERGLPVMWIGDLNVAHMAQDIWNDGAKHLAKQAGVTEAERRSFQEQLNSGFYDAFRRLHPETSGQYSYWSQRAGNREPNKGLRLDYFVCSSDFFAEESSAIVRDSYILPNVIGSDHCPVVLELEVKQS